MEIGPLSNKQPVPPEGGRVRSSQPETPASPKEQTDRVEISSDARTRLAEAADARLAEEQQARREKLDLIRERIKSGFYERPEVDQQVADRLIDDLDL